MNQDQLQTTLLAAAEAERHNDWNQAAEYYRQALPLLPGDHRLPTNLGNALWLADQPAAARQAYDQAIAMAPDEPVPLLGLGNVLRDLNAFEQADEAYGRSRQLSDQDLTAWNHSQLLLGLERYDDAFGAAERRLELEAMLPFRRGPYARPASHASLRAEPSEAPLHLWSEQGLGDTLQYVRWLTLLGERANAITLEVEHQLVPLLQMGLDWLPHAPQVVAKPADGGPAPLIQTAQAPLMSLPHHLGAAPLSRAFAHDQAGAWLGYLRHPSWGPGRQQPQPRVGLVWAAGRKLNDPFTAREYRKRSLPPPLLGVLIEGLHQAGVELVNLQFGDDSEAASALRAYFTEALPRQADFAATAAVVRQLDLVITVDTAMAHLCGALAQPAWVLLPWSADPRWLRQRTDSPWYPTLKLWRQPQTGDWLRVVEAVLDELPRWWSALSSHPAS